MIGRMLIKLHVHFSGWTDGEPRENSGRTGSILAENLKLGTPINPINRFFFFFFSGKSCYSFEEDLFEGTVHFDGPLCDETRLISRWTFRLKPTQVHTNKSCCS
jgi:hypothetical protein